MHAIFSRAGLATYTRFRGSRSRAGRPATIQVATSGAAGAGTGGCCRHAGQASGHGLLWVQTQQVLALFAAAVHHDCFPSPLHAYRQEVSLVLAALLTLRRVAIYHPRLLDDSLEDVSQVNRV